MTEEQERAITNLRSGNLELSSLVKDAVLASITRASEMIPKTSSPRDLNDCIKVIETASKVVGLSPKESQTNIQINAINGFEFIEYTEDELPVLTQSVEDAEYEEI